VIPPGRLLFWRAVRWRTSFLVSVAGASVPYDGDRTVTPSDGRLEVDNNAAERAMRGVALGRKNWLFAGSEGGGRAAAIALTLIETAKLNKVDLRPGLPMCRGGSLSIRSGVWGSWRLGSCRFIKRDKALFEGFV
jgi:hypothetical protein